MAPQLTAERTGTGTQDWSRRGLSRTSVPPDHLEAGTVLIPVVGKIMAPENALVLIPQICDTQKGLCKCAQVTDLTRQKTGLSLVVTLGPSG